ncbi:unnamed protein product [Miscanthus lutarioriparius]|uniref:Uncharacterized protein n=1 Tax=Miscanthus lutarioriparius TaxID=422564 RepID=A0A811QH94_9POAL|nr:unnamed protein product [Miscanthus lutarioriparius]
MALSPYRVAVSGPSSQPATSRSARPSRQVVAVQSVGRPRLRRSIECVLQWINHPHPPPGVHLQNHPMRRPIYTRACIGNPGKSGAGVIIRRLDGSVPALHQIIDQIVQICKLHLEVAIKRQAMQDLAGSSSVTDQACQYMGGRELSEFCFLKMENQMLHEECSQFEMAEKELLLKEHNLRLEIRKVREQYKSLVDEHLLVSTVPAQC